MDGGWTRKDVKTTRTTGFASIRVRAVPYDVRVVTRNRPKRSQNSEMIPSLTLSDTERKY